MVVRYCGASLGGFTTECPLCEHYGGRQCSQVEVRRLGLSLRDDGRLIGHKWPPGRCIRLPIVWIIQSEWKKRRVGILREWRSASLLPRRYTREESTLDRAKDTSLGVRQGALISSFTIYEMGFSEERSGQARICLPTNVLGVGDAPVNKRAG